MGRLGNTPTKQTNFFLDRGKSFAFDMLFEVHEAGPYDLTGCTVRLVVQAPRNFGGADLVQKIALEVDLPAGHVQFQLQASELYIATGEYPIDVTLVNANNYSTPVLKGLFIVGDNTDDTINNVYDGAASQPGVTVVLGGGTVVKVCLHHGIGGTGTSGTGAEEVWVGPDEPPLRQELWIDTDMPDPSGSETAVGYYRHDQAAPSSAWVVVHDLGYRPAVHVQDADGNVMVGSVQHLSETTLVITLTSAAVGSAHCS
jgi:hypothetical protein